MSQWEFLLLPVIRMLWIVQQKESTLSARIIILGVTSSFIKQAQLDKSGGRLTVQSLLKKLCKHTNKNVVWKEKLVERGAQATGITTPLTGLWFKAYFGKMKAQCAAGVIASKPIAYMGYNCPIPCVKPLLKHRHCQKHLTWAKEKKD